MLVKEENFIKGIESVIQKQVLAKTGDTVSISYEKNFSLIEDENKSIVIIFKESSVCDIISKSFECSTDQCSALTGMILKLIYSENFSEESSLSAYFAEDELINVIETHGTDDFIPKYSIYAMRRLCRQDSYFKFMLNDRLKKGEKEEKILKFLFDSEVMTDDETADIYSNILKDNLI